MAAARSFPMVFVDAFTKEPFGGNPAAVCLVGTQPLSDDVYQKIAMEINLSETAFIRQLSDDESYESGSQFHLRWFTPTNEVPLCGHATLASAATIFNVSGNQSKEITFDTLSGPLKARRDGNYIILDLPLGSTEKVPQDDLEIEKIVKLVVGDAKKCADVQYSKALKKLLVRLEDNATRQDLESFSPDPQALLAAHDGSKVRGVCVTLKGSKDNGSVDSSGETYDFISRYFAPWNGIPEDPVTGSAHTILGSYWSGELNSKELYARQCSRRGGELRLVIRDDGRIDVKGQSVVVLKGSLTL